MDMIDFSMLTDTQLMSQFFECQRAALQAVGDQGLAACRDLAAALRDRMFAGDQEALAAWWADWRPLIKGEAGP